MAEITDQPLRRLQRCADHRHRPVAIERQQFGGFERITVQPGLKQQRNQQAIQAIATGVHQAGVQQASTQRQLLPRPIEQFQR